MKKTIILSIAIALVSIFSINAQKSGYKIGDVATDFSLKGTDDKYHSLSDYKDAKGYVVIFTCNHCPYSKKYESRIIDLQTKYAKQGYPVIAINPNDPTLYEADSFENMKKRAKEKGFNFPYVIDAEQTVFPQYGAKKTPHVFLLDKNRVVKYIGGIDNSPKLEKVTTNYLADAIEALKKGKNPNPSKTKAIGCSIKYKTNVN